MTNKFNGFDADDHRFRIRGYQQICSSVTGALITSLFMTPLDVIKTRLQVQQKLLLSNKCYLYCNGLMDHLCPCGPVNLPVQKFNGTADAFVKIIKTEGVPSLWSGLSPTLVLAIPTTVLYFVSYEQMRVRLKDFHMKTIKANTDTYKMPMWIPLLAGSSARILAVTVVNPLELIRTKMQSEKMSYKEVGTAFTGMLRQHGIRGLFKGLPPTIMRDTPFSAIYWTSYESFKKFKNITNPDIFEAFVGGALAGSLAAFLTCPFDVIKTHQQIEFGEKFLYYTNGNKNGNGQKKSMTSMKERLNNIWKTSGFRGLFAGLTPRLFKVAPACAIMISTYEYGKTFFHAHNVKRYYEQNPELRNLS
ncbi:hypothetical protein PVAND_007348 [Polypedilum vanderplanki]|uniref:Mitochondrial carrier protein n=1 Tax=Polypedilum vanderplanki TaxID=319348 RepID=A0A9J6C612_POLVA|nr:hypothetical protein PVAND_007348 [Polypedilum vanderplanki]